MSITIYNTVEAIKDTIGAAGEVDVSTANETLLEGVNEFVTVQVYPETGEGAANSRTDRSTFKGGIKAKRWTVFVDAYARQRSHIGEDMAAVANVADSIIDKLEEQNDTPPFGLAGLKTFKYSWQRVTFVYGDPQVSYVGIRFTIDLMLG